MLFALSHYKCKSYGDVAPGALLRSCMRNSVSVAAREVSVVSQPSFSLTHAHVHMHIFTLSLSSRLSLIYAGQSHHTEVKVKQFCHLQKCSACCLMVLSLCFSLLLTEVCTNAHQLKAVLLVRVQHLWEDVELLVIY